MQYLEKIPQLKTMTLIVSITLNLFDFSPEVWWNILLEDYGRIL